MGQVIIYRCPRCGWSGPAEKRIQFDNVPCCPECVRRWKTPTVPKRVVVSSNVKQED